MSTILLQRFANREIRIGCQNIVIPIKDFSDSKDIEQSTRFSQKVLDFEVSRANANEGYRLGQDRKGCVIAIPYTQQEHEAVAKRLDIRNEFQERQSGPKIKGGWGSDPKVTTFGKNARHRILEAGAIMDELCGKNVVEVTCTIPGSTDSSFRTVSKYSGWIMNRLTQIVRDSKGDPVWFYVWELQKRGALHLHFAIGCSNLPDAIALAEKIRFKWFQLLLKLKDKSNVDVFAKNDKFTWRDLPKHWKSHVLPIRKSVSAYFSKYAGKQSRNPKSDSTAYPPARWWGSSQSIKEGIKNARVSMSIEVSSKNVEAATSYLRDVLLSLQPIKSYRYEFDLGESKKGRYLGNGWREISYFNDSNFASISAIISILCNYVTQTWGIYADMIDPRTQTSKINYKTNTQT